MSAANDFPLEKRLLPLHRYSMRFLMPAFLGTIIAVGFWTASQEILGFLIGVTMFVYLVLLILKIHNERHKNE